MTGERRDPAGTAHLYAANAVVMSHLNAKAVLCRKLVTPGGFVGILHRHVGLEIIYCLAGRGSLKVGSQVVPFQAGHLLYFDCRVPHQAIVEGDYVRWSVCFWPESLDELARDPMLAELLAAVRPGPDELRVYTIPAAWAGRLERHLEDLADEIKAMASDFYVMLKLHLAELHVLLRRVQYQAVSPAGKVRSASKDRIPGILDYIEANLSAPLSADEIAAHFHYSPSHLNRLVRQATGQSLSGYIRFRRLERAKRLLLHTGLSVSAVAAAVGIANVPYFCRSFRLETGYTPGSFRALHQVSLPR